MELQGPDVEVLQGRALPQATVHRVARLVAWKQQVLEAQDTTCQG